MRKQIVHQDAQNASAVNPVWLDLQGLAQVELTSEDQRSWRSSVVAGPEESVRQETDHANQIMPVGSRRAHFACSQKATKWTLISLLTFSESLWSLWQRSNE